MCYSIIDKLQFFKASINITLRDLILWTFIYNIHQGAILLQILLFSIFKFQVRPSTVSSCRRVWLCPLLSVLLILVGCCFRMMQACGSIPDMSITVSATNIPSREFVSSTTRVSSPTLALVTRETAPAFSQWILPVWVQSETEAWPDRSRERTAVLDSSSCSPLLPVQSSVFPLQNSVLLLLRCVGCMKI